MEEHIEASKNLLNIEINSIDEAICALQEVKSFCEISITQITEDLSSARKQRVSRMENLDLRLADHREALEERRATAS